MLYISHSLQDVCNFTDIIVNEMHDMNICLIFTYVTLNL
jgi:hypothetical protein